ncbi:GNAT family N-acetyltransferase [Methylobacterium iners]|uniref:N-acetyltransferase domain-containing protein n=1 Tax=Methylobacterium iners TaxID=418707 RepID=A0ABQ4RZA3_9HYPH|nr:GNAT family N-acetyltransferase [Methylobacterium iners]GJD96159.1 hypothetical protein OCOJLMKI_3377 [Methylobacterium iners]
MDDNATLSRFELVVADQIVFANYRRQPGILVITYVYAPPLLRGTGTAGRLMEAVAVHARAEGLRIVALCGYARAWLQRQPEHRDLLN